MERRALRPRKHAPNYEDIFSEPSPPPPVSLKTSIMPNMSQVTKNHSVSQVASIKKRLPTEIQERAGSSVGNKGSDGKDSFLPPTAVSKRMKKGKIVPKSKPQKSAPTSKQRMTNNFSSTLPPPPDFEPLIHPVPLHKAYNNLPKDLRGIDIMPHQIFDLFFTPEAIELMVKNTNRYAEKQMQEQGNADSGRNARWKDLTASDLYIWLGITIHMGCLGLAPAHYWRKDGRLLSRDGLPTTPFMSQMKFEQIRRYFHVSSPDENPSPDQPWHYKIDPLLNQLRQASQQYRVPGSCITMDEAMILCTGRSVHITRMPNKPIGVGYKFFALAEKGYVWDFYPSSGVKGLDPVDIDSTKLDSDYSNTSKMVHTLVRRLRMRHRKKAFNVFMDNYFTTVPLLAELRRMGVGGCGTARSNLKGFPKELSVGKDAKLPHHFKAGTVKDGVAVLVWMDNAPVTVMTTIHPINGEDSQGLSHRWHAGEDVHEKKMIPIVILAYNKHKVGVDVADQYRTYYDTQLTSRRNWYPIFYWILETVLINSLIIYRDHKGTDVDHLDFRLDVLWALIERGVGEIKVSRSGLGMSRRKRSAESELVSSTFKRVTKNSKLPGCRKAPGGHFPVYMETRLHCFLCRWNLKDGDKGTEAGKTGVKCGFCNEPLCLTKERNCFYNFHVL